MDKHNTAIGSIADKLTTTHCNVCLGRRSWTPVT